MRRCGLDGGLSSPAFWVERRRVLWRGSKEQAKGRTEWKAGVFVVPVHVLGEGGGLCLGRATATAWWRPAAALGGVALQERLQREAKGSGGGAARRVGASAKQEGAGLALHCAGDGTAQRRR